ncbi:Endo-polygalacturonase [Arthrobotrys entomopaga]|nr:Endo-polygalacturonase [Arthrobotrys entomopaga]
MLNYLPDQYYCASGTTFDLSSLPSNTHFDELHHHESSYSNTPVQAVSIDGANGLTITGMTVGNTAGNSLEKNTDGFDINIGDSTNVVIDGANAMYTTYQDDCEIASRSTREL